MLKLWYRPYAGGKFKTHTKLVEKMPDEDLQQRVMEVAIERMEEFYSSQHVEDPYKGIMWLSCSFVSSSRQELIQTCCSQRMLRANLLLRASMSRRQVFGRFGSRKRLTTHALRNSGPGSPPPNALLPPAGVASHSFSS